MKSKSLRTTKATLRGTARYYRVVLRSKEGFTLFRIQDVGRKGHVQRVAGKQPNGKWETQSWLVSKEDAHTAGRYLIADSTSAQELFATFAHTPINIEGDVFETKDSREIMGEEQLSRIQKHEYHGRELAH